MQPYYAFNVAAATYADDIDTGSGMTVAYCDRVFFAGHPNAWSSREDLRHILHELEHLQQCQQRGRRTFLAEYVLKVGLDIVKTGRLDVHDVHDFEVAANAKANSLTDKIWSQMQLSGTSNGGNGSAPSGMCYANEVYMPTLGGACCTPNYSKCRNLTSGVVTCGAFGCN